MTRPLTRLWIIVSVAITTFGVGPSAFAGTIRYDAAEVAKGWSPYANTVARGLNDSGQVVGIAYENAAVAGFISTNGQVTRSQAIDPRAISNSGLDVGSGSFSPSGLYVYPYGPKAFIQRDGEYHGSYIANGILTDLGSLEPGGMSSASGVNDHYQATGSSSLGGIGKPVLYSDGRVIPIGLLPGTNRGGGAAINSRGEVAGVMSTLGQQGSHGFLYIAGRTIDIGSLGGSIEGIGGLNDASQVVGSSLTADGQRRAFLYEDGKILDLNTLLSAPGLVLTEAVGINIKGQIAANAVDAQGHIHALLLSPTTVPEPSILAFAGVVGLGLLIRRRRRRVIA